MNDLTGSATAGSPRESRLANIEAKLKDVCDFCESFAALMEQQKNTIPSNHIELAKAAQAAARRVSGAANV